MKRRRYMVCYDISDSKRLSQMGSRIMSFGYRMQYSVYLCDLDSIERIQLLYMIKETINEKEDCVAIVDLGEVIRNPEQNVEWIGRTSPPPRNGATIW